MFLSNTLPTWPYQGLYTLKCSEIFDTLPRSCLPEVPLPDFPNILSLYIITLPLNPA
jgi:hypothetical protein